MALNERAWTYEHVEETIATSRCHRKGGAERNSNKNGLQTNENIRVQEYENST